MFSFQLLCKFSWIFNFAIFVQIFMKLSLKCRTKKLGIVVVIVVVVSGFQPEKAQLP